MKKGFKRIIGGLLSAAMVVSSLTVVNISTASAAASLEATGSGWFESVYAEWPPVDGTAYYIAEVRPSGGTYETVDDMLIRQYDSFNRVDVVGLAAGNYDLKITAYDSENNVISSDEVTGLEAKKYDRGGGAFSQKSLVASSAPSYADEGIGAYKNDGTLKDGAKVFYVTPETAKTITTNVITSSKGATTTATGIQSIIDLYQKGYDKTPLDFRIIGLVSKDDLDKISSKAEGLQVKGKTTYSQLNITFEGIGNDAAVTDFGFLVRNAASVEFRNFAVLNFMDDGISIDTANSNIWVHNMDLFYGGVGGDADQAKGDGSVDIKGKSTNITVSYNHFWDSGKCSLCGMGSETGDSLITYHHNWFDHSDSRHPRVRAMSVHLYNNYYDGNAKYGAASAVGASIFAEKNYFRSVKYPVIIGGQGHEAGEVLSGEKGAPIKMFDNIMAGSYQYTDYADNKSSYDGYKVSSASETIPSSVTAVGGTYNNFDTDPKFDLHYDVVTSTADVPSYVMANAGRCNGGDIFHSFSTSDDADYSVNNALKSKVTGYKSNVRTVGGTVIPGSTNPNNPSGKPSTDPDYTDRDDQNQGNAGELPDKDQGSSGDHGGSTSPSGYDLVLKGADLSNETLTSNKTGLGTNGAFSIIATPEASVTINGTIRLGGAGDVNKRAVKVDIPASASDATIYVQAASSSTDTRYLAINNGTEELVSDIEAPQSVKLSSYGPVSGGTYYIYSKDKGINISLVGVNYSGGGTVTPVEPDDGNDPSLGDDDDNTGKLPSDDDDSDAPSKGMLIWNLTDGTNTLNAVINGKEWSSAHENPVTYQGKALTKAIKMESSTTFEFTTGADGKLTVVSFVEPSFGKAGVIKLDGNNVTLDSSNITTVDLPAGNHKIQKNTTKTHIYYLGVDLGGSEEGSETTTEAPAESTTLDPVEVGEVITENVENGTVGSSGSINYTDDGNGNYGITDTLDGVIGNTIFPFEAISNGTVVIRGSVTPGSDNGGWSFVQVVGTKSGMEGLSDVFSARSLSDNDINRDSNGIGSVRDINLRVAEKAAANTGVSIRPARSMSYEFIIDFTSKTARLSIEGRSTDAVSFGDAGIENISGVRFVTAGGSRNISMTKPYVGIVADKGEDVTTEATTTEATTTEATTVETPSEETTGTIPTPGDADGNVDGDSRLTANDAAAVLAKVLNPALNGAGWKFEEGDVNGSGELDGDDAAQILSKVLDVTFAYKGL